jgi:hypothetical protein
MEMYYLVSKPGQVERYICLRRSSKLEGYHLSCHGVIAGANTSSDTADDLMSNHNHRRGIDADIRNGGQVSYGMYDLRIPREINAMCKRLQAAPPYMALEPIEEGKQNDP